MLPKYLESKEFDEELNKENIRDNNNITDDSQTNIVRSKLLRLKAIKKTKKKAQIES